MSAISLKSITGITSITTPTGVDNVFTVHTNDTTERFRVDQTGNLNIAGIVTVTKDLDVDGHTNLDNVSVAGVTTSTGNIYADNYFGNGGITLNNNGNPSVNLTSTSTTGSSRINFGDPDSSSFGKIYYIHDGDYFKFDTAGSEKLRITSAGNIGIGITNPSKDFEVYRNGLANAKIKGNVSGGLGAELILQNANAAANGYSEIQFQDAGTNIFSKIRGFNLTDGSNNGYMALYTASATEGLKERVRISDAGRVGIGTDDPSYILSVVGDSGITQQALTNSTHGQLSIVGRNSAGGISAISRFKSYPDGSSNQSHFAIETRNSSAAMVEALRITSDQKVGIGTNNPSAAFLDIASSQATDSLRLRRLNSDANIASNWSLKPYGGNLYFREGGSTDKIVFTDDPKVSIGGHTPGSILDMRASGQVDVLIGSTNAGGAYLLLDGDSNGDGVGADYSYIAHDTGGDLLIGADNPAGDADIVFKIGDNTEKLRLKASTGQMLLTSGMLLNIGGNQGHCPLHVTTENTTYGKSAIFGASGWVNSANYHYTDATITLLGRDVDNNDKGAGVEFTARNTGDTNWLHGAVTFGQDGGLRLFNGGAGNTVGTERFRIASDGVTHLNSPDSASGGRLWANSSALYLQSGNGRQTFKVSDAAAGQNRTIEMTTDGHIKFPAGYGIEFGGGTPNAGSNPTVNTAIFDDYEEGKFEPKFLENGTTESNYAWRYGSYVKVGGIVHIRLAFGLNGFNSSGGNFTTGFIGGMPYTHASPWGNSDFAYIQLIGYSYASGYGDSGNTTQLSLELSQNADKFRVVNGQGKGNINQSSIGTGQRIAVTFSYPVA